MKLTTNKHKIIIIISVIFINAFANAQALICDTIPIWSDVKIILCREQHFLKFKNTDEQGGYFVTFYDTINKSTIVIKRLTWNLIPSKYAKDIITNKINACDTTIIFGTYLNTNTNATNNFKQKIYPSFEISYWDVTDSLKTTYDSIINSISIFQTKEPIDTIRYDQSGDTTYVQRNASDTHFRAHYGNYVKETGQPDKIYNEEGYIALHGDSVSYHFFERDYLGSVRAVFDLYGNLEQTNDYNVTGIPSSRHLGNADVHKHTGKEFQGFNGLAWYDNNARYYDPILARFTTQDPLAEKYPWLSPYNHCTNNPIKLIDPDGKQTFAIHGTWSDQTTWQDKSGINRYTTEKFGNSKHDYDFSWSGGNYAKDRTAATLKLISHIRKYRKDHSLTSSEPITLVGHSHGGNVAIETANLMVNMAEFDGIKINLLTINTPVRYDYQLNNTALKRVDHINVYDPKDPIQVNGGNASIKMRKFGPSLLDGIGEFGPAGRTFKNATNIEVNNPQGLIQFNWFKTKIGDFHNSHNRTQDWIYK